MTEHRRGLTGDWYTDPVIFDEELELIFSRSWQMVGHCGQLRTVGDYLTATVGDQGVAVTRLANGRLHAMYNVCQHRGHELLVDPAGSTKTIVCPYHAWTYDLDGQLVHARGETVGELCVPSIRVETLAGFVFVNLDDRAASLADTLAGVEADLLALVPSAADRTLTHRRTHVIDANWKLVVENYNECYHCPNVHKFFTDGVVSPDSYSITGRGKCIHHTADAPASTGYTLADGGEPYGAFYTFPTSSIQCYPGEVLNTYRWVPLAVNQTLLIREWWFDEAEPTGEQQELIELDWQTTVAEDLDLVISVQRGMQSRGYTPGPLIEHPTRVATTQSEDPVPHLHDLVRTALGR